MSNRPHPTGPQSRSARPDTLARAHTPAAHNGNGRAQRNGHSSVASPQLARDLSLATNQGTRDLSIVILSYNTRDILRECLRSVFRTTHRLRFEVVVVDNASRDGSAQMVAREFPEVVLIRNGRNEGFSIANNRALEVCRGRYVLLLNSDTIVLPGTLANLVDSMDGDPEIGVAGCRLERPNGELDLACRRSFPTPMVSLYRFLRLSRLLPSHRRFARYNLTYLDPEGDYEVDSIVGAFMLIRKEVIGEMGGLDEDFFMYGEDLDWCYRVRERNWKVWYYGGSRVIHYKGASSSQESFRMNYHFHRAMYLFHRKHLRHRYPAPINGLVYLGIGARLVALAVQHPFRKLVHRLGSSRAGRSDAADGVYPCEFFFGPPLEGGA